VDRKNPLKAFLTPEVYNVINENKQKGRLGKTQCRRIKRTIAAG